ncbi:MAG: thioredoxin domain-containing protein [Elusimicrobiales bacterium]|nr:thioredoxin domain-containing protein [Elusimicrobiales bacterium]NLH39148.1 thioredoxin domain-containing protein [Elusimicrobiota bacterium]
MKKITGIKIIAGFFLLLAATVIILITTEEPKEVLYDTEKTPSYRQKGNSEAKIVIIEYTDFACPACAAANTYVSNLIKYFGDDFNVNFKHYPLTSIHPYSFNAAVWSECVGKEYNKFWEFSDMLFNRRLEWWDKKDYSKLFKAYAAELGIDDKRIAKCLGSSDAIDLVKKDMESGDKFKVDSTPTFFVNGRKAVGVMELIEEIKKEKQGGL